MRVGAEIINYFLFARSRDVVRLAKLHDLWVEQTVVFRGEGLSAPRERPILVGNRIRVPYC